MKRLQKAESRTSEWFGMNTWEITFDSRYTPQGGPRVEASACEIGPAGTLTFFDSSGAVVCAYAPGAWQQCRLVLQAASAQA